MFFKRIELIKNMIIELTKKDVQPGYPDWHGIHKLQLPQKPGVQGGVTWCNRFLERMLLRYGYDTEILHTYAPDLGVKIWGSANTLCNRLEDGVKAGSIIRLDEHDAKQKAWQAQIAIAAWENLTGSGHVAVVFPNLKKLQVAQAGAKNGIFDIDSRWAFGDRPYRLYAYS